MEISDHYAQTLDSFRRHSTYIEACTDWIKFNTPELVKNMLKTCTLKDGEKMRILSIGSGEGKPDAAILDEVLKLKIPVHYTAVDPSVEHMKTFEANVSRNSQYAGVEFNLKVMSAEDFLSADIPQEKFHLISFVHSLYYFYDQVGDILQDYHKLTEKGGLMMSITSEKDSFYKKFEGKMPITAVAWAHDIDAALDKRNLPFKRAQFHFEVYTGSVFESSKDGDLLLDFFTHVPHFRETSEAELLKNVLAEIKNLSVKEDNKLIYKVPTGVHIINKL